MWNDRVRLAERVQGDWETLCAEDKDVARIALERLDEDPILGAPLFPPFKGLWSYRLGVLRVLYRIAPEAKLLIVMKIERVDPQ